MHECFYCKRLYKIKENSNFLPDVCSSICFFLYESALLRCYNTILPVLGPFYRPQSWTGWISARIFWLSFKERRMLRKQDYHGRLLFFFFFFFDRWMTDLATHRQKKVQAMSWKNLQMLKFCLFTWSWIGPINGAPNPRREKVKKKTKINCKTVIFQWIQMKFRTKIRNQKRNNLR